MIQRLIAAAVLVLMVLAGGWFYSFLHAAAADIQQVRKAQCAVAYELVLRQLLERADAPDGQVSAPLLTQLQILENQPCVEGSLRADLLPRGGVARLLPLVKAASAPQGLRAFVATLYPLLQEISGHSTAGASSQSRMLRVQARYREAMPLLGRLEQGAATGQREALQKHIDAVRADFGAGADTDSFEVARVAYNEALQKILQALDRNVPAPALSAAARLARSRLSRLYDAAIVGQNTALQARIEARQLDQRLASIALAVLIAILLIGGLLIAAAIERDRRQRLQGLVAMSRRTAKGELGLVVDARGGGKVSELEAAFNQMTTDLSKRYQKIIDELNIALDTAKTAERAKSDFLHNVSHEIRTPMNAILGMSHITLQTTLDRKQKDYIGTIHKEAKALIALINDILDFSKIEAGKMVAEPVEFDLGELLTELAREARAKASAKDLAFSLVVADAVPLALVGDAAKLGQLLTHYLNNAVKFTERGHVSLSVSPLRATDPQRVALCFEVADTGIGMTTEQRGQLFKSIRQGDGSATRKHGGVGLGLVISKQLADLMQGQVGAESTLGEGSRFWLELGFGRAQTLLPKPFTANPEPADEAAAGESPAASQPIATREFDAAVLQKLKTQIEDYDTEASDTIAELQGMQGVDEAVRVTLEGHVGNFDFDAATALLPSLCTVAAAEGQ